MSTLNMWEYSDDTWSGVDLVGFSVEALDGSVGKIDEASNDVGARYIVVDTGPWIFGKKVLLPAGIIDGIDLDDTTVYAQRTKDEIKNAPQYDADRMADAAYRAQFGSYYERRRSYDKPVGTRSTDA